MKIRIGSRASQLAVAQADWIAHSLAKADRSISVEMVRTTTTGDRDAHASLQAIGGKGVFVKELEEALLKKEIDVAVHSLKDVPAQLPAGLRLGPAPLREDIRDAVISRFGELLRELPKGSTVGTGSPRRVAQVRRAFWKRGYRIEPIRGNVDTRVRKVKDGQYDAIVLAAAGLKRLGLEGEITEILDPVDMVPAPGQGCLGLEVREDDADILKALETIKDPVSDVTSRAERSFLQALGGDCLVPVGAYSSVVGNTLVMKAVLLDAAGERAINAAEDGPTSEAELVGAKLAGRLLFEGGSEILLKSGPKQPA